MNGQASQESVQTASVAVLHRVGAAMAALQLGKAVRLVKADSSSQCFRMQDAALHLGETAVVAGHGEVNAATQLAKLAGLQPAISITTANAVESVSEQDIRDYAHALAENLREVSRARLPLKQAEQAEIILFRAPYVAQEHLAIRIGNPEAQDAPLVRVHSSCLTGDVLGSLRCDCGDQLHTALDAIGAEGHGLLVYLNQEGRGIGLANKLLAYALQDQGMDTVDANEALGFDADERDFTLAASILHQLGLRKIRLLTNNPAKVAVLGTAQIEVTARVPLAIPANPHNADYLKTKETRCGHHF